MHNIWLCACLEHFNLNTLGCSERVAWFGQLPIGHLMFTLCGNNMNNICYFFLLTPPNCIGFDFKCFRFFFCVSSHTHTHLLVLAINTILWIVFSLKWSFARQNEILKQFLLSVSIQIDVKSIPPPPKKICGKLYWFNCRNFSFGYHSDWLNYCRNVLGSL